MNTNHDALREALELLRIFKNNLGPNRAALTAEDAILWDRVEALSQPMPEAAAQGWKLVPVEPTKEMVKAAMPWALGDHAGVYRAMLSASPAAAAITHANQALEWGGE